MAVIAGKSFWPHSCPKIVTHYPKLKDNITCDVLVVGGGITGALCAYYMNNARIDTVLIDKNTFASGSTRISTALLHYEMDTHLNKLSHLYDRTKAIRYYQLFRKSLYDLRALLVKTDLEADYIKRRSLYVSNRLSTDLQLLIEYRSRISAGFKTTFVDKRNMKNYFALPFSSGLYSYDGAEINPYQLTHQLINYTVNKGVRAYEKTPFLSIQFGKRYNLVHTPSQIIRAKKVIFATGFEAQKVINHVATTRTNISYTLTTEPLSHEILWKDQCLIWSVGRPHLYLRTTSDHRIVIGGLETPYEGNKPSADLLRRKCSHFTQQLKYLFPELTIHPAYCSAGLYTTTHDGLGYVDELPEYPNCYFLLSYGCNGILSSLIGSKIIRDLYLYNYHHDAHMFSFHR